MRCLKVLVILMTLLCVVVNAQCVARCAIVPCGQPDVPPCHQSKSPAPLTKACASPIDAREERTTVVPLVAIEPATVSVAQIVIVQRVELAIAPSASPGEGQSFTILRI